jgi:ABC-2 type transport system permease protein
VPRWTSGAWILLILFLVVGELGTLLGLPAWLTELSPFAHLPSLPGGSVTVAPLLVLVASAVALVASGSVGFRRRDVG